ncbi:MAG: acyltransferase family protein [Nitrososphaerales archaeon]
MTTTSPTSNRRYDLDWLRVLLILAVFFFHLSRFFDNDFWHVKNGTTYPFVNVVIAYVGSWLMPLIFIASGASLFLMMGKGSGARSGSGARPGGFAAFFKDKSLRLLVPLLVGIFSHIMFQVYLEKVSHHLFYGSFWQFIPQYFHGWYGLGGNFAWMGLHLWYLLMLFVFTLAAYPLFILLRGPARRVLDAFTRFLALPGAMYLLAIPTVLSVVFIDPQSLLGRRDWGGWSIASHFWFFFAGFVIISSNALQGRVKRWRWMSTALGLIALGGLLAIYLRFGEPRFGTDGWQLFWGTMGLLSWAWMLAFLGHGMRRLTFNTPFLRYANEAVLPFYILHQSVLLTVGYVVVQWPIPDLAKFFFIGVVTFAIIMILYEFAIRRHNVLRFLFGMRLLPRQTAPAASRVIGRPAPGI